MEKLYFLGVLSWLAKCNADFDDYGVRVFDKYYYYTSTEDTNRLYKLFKDHLDNEI